MILPLAVGRHLVIELPDCQNLQVLPGFTTENPLLKNPPHYNTLVPWFRDFLPVPFGRTLTEILINKIITMKNRISKIFLNMS